MFYHYNALIAFLMSKYAIIKIGAFQYTVEEGKEYEVPKFKAEAGKNYDSVEVLAVANGEEIEFGKPTLQTKVVLNILEQAKGEKVTTKVYKAKSRYRRTRGFRKQVTKFKVASIGGTKASKTEKATKPVKKATVKAKK